MTWLAEDWRVEHAKFLIETADLAHKARVRGWIFRKQRALRPIPRKVARRNTWTFPNLGEDVLLLMRDAYDAEHVRPPAIDAWRDLGHGYTVHLPAELLRRVMPSPFDFPSELAEIDLGPAMPLLHLRARSR